MFRKFAVLFLVLLSVSSACAFDGITPEHKLFNLQTQIFTLVNHYWACTELLIKFAQDPSDANFDEYSKAVEIQKKLNIDLGKGILVSLERTRENIEFLSEIYKSLEPNARQALYPSLGFLRTELLQLDKAPLTEAEFREYFPGYGYTEPGYKYRKGREVEREFKGTTWQSEEHSITSTWNVELTISIDLLDILRKLLSNGTIKNLKEGPHFEQNVNGQPMICLKVSFQLIKAIVTKTNRKFDVNKVWFELLRAKISGWSTGPYEVCGKTYEILQEPTGEEVVTGITE